MSIKDSEKSGDNNVVAKKGLSFVMPMIEASPIQNELASHPIAVAIDNVMHRIRDIQVALAVHIPISINRQLDSFKALQTIATDSLQNLESEDPEKLIRGVRDAIRTRTRFERLSQSKVPQILEQSLFVGLFSVFDAYMGELVKAIYEKKPALFNGINRSITLGELLQYQSVDILKQDMLEDEIDTLRRNSYVDQFSELEKKFSIGLRAFSRWPEFVEVGQRRNLMTHCDGRVSDQYLAVCDREGVVFANRPKVGEVLSLGGKYVKPATEVVMEVALMLGQTLWRKVFEGEIDLADEHLNRTIYTCLVQERWTTAKRFADFSTQDHLLKKTKDLQKRFEL